MDRPKLPSAQDFERMTRTELEYLHYHTQIALKRIDSPLANTIDKFKKDQIVT